MFEQYVGIYGLVCAYVKYESRFRLYHIIGACFDCTIRDCSDTSQRFL